VIAPIPLLADARGEELAPELDRPPEVRDGLVELALVANGPSTRLKCGAAGERAKVVVIVARGRAARGRVIAPRVAGAIAAERAASEHAPPGKVEDIFRRAVAQWATCDANSEERA
jgi:hypothetical protein